MTIQFLTTVFNESFLNIFHSILYHTFIFVFKTYKYFKNKVWILFLKVSSNYLKTCFKSGHAVFRKKIKDRNVIT